MKCPNCQTIFAFAVPEENPRVELAHCPACGQAHELTRLAASMVHVSEIELAGELGLAVRKQAALRPKPPDSGR